MPRFSRIKIDKDDLKSEFKKEVRIPFFLIVRHLKRTNKWTLAFIIFLMSVAFINLVFINSLFQGVVETDHRQLIETTTGNVTLLPVEENAFISGVECAVAEILRVNGVVGVSDQVVLPGVVEWTGARKNIELWAVTPSREEKVSVIDDRVISGSYFRSDDETGVLIGKRLLTEENSGVVGDIFKKRCAVTLEIGGRRLEVPIVGVFETLSDYADSRVYVPRSLLEKNFHEYTDRATRLIIKTREKGGEPELVKKLKKTKAPGKFVTWQEASERSESLTESFVTINALLTTVGFIIAAVTIFIIMYVDITHKRLEIGVLRALGIKSHIIATTFVLQTIVYSMFGVMVGAGLFFGIIMPYFRWKPFIIPIGAVELAVIPADFVSRAVAVVLVAIASGLIPAILTLRQKILDEIMGR